MYAIIRMEKGIYYTSMVFGCYCPITTQDDYQKYLQSIHNRYYLVLNRDKTAIIKQYVFTSKSKYLDPAVIIVDGDMTDWKLDANEEGCVDFLSGIQPENFEECISGNLLQKCIQADAAYNYKEYHEVHTDSDIENLMWAAGYFHDARISKCEMNQDGALYVLMTDIWGCSIEIWFSGDVEYDIKSRDPEEYDPYWYGSTVIIKDAFIYFVDEDDMTVEEITNGYCWFKARNMKYRIIPNERFVWERE